MSMEYFQRHGRWTPKKALLQRSRSIYKIGGDEGI